LFFFSHVGKLIYTRFPSKAGIAVVFNDLFETRLEESLSKVEFGWGGVGFLVFGKVLFEGVACIFVG